MQCLICGSGVVDSRPIDIDHFVWDRMMAQGSRHSQWLTCGLCLFQWLEHRFTPDQCLRYYDQYGRDGYLTDRVRYHGHQILSIFPVNAYPHYYQSRQRQLVEFFRSRPSIQAARILDYGGEGWFVCPSLGSVWTWNLAQGFRAPWAQSYQEQLYDLVICQQVLEHVMDPLAVVQDLVTRVRSQGWVYLEVPIEPAPQHWVGEHVQVFSAESLRCLAGGLDQVDLVMPWHGAISLIGRRP